MDLYKNKYRIPSARAQWWDYKSEGMYFITICTQHRKHYFGTVYNGEMNLSLIGKIVETEWLETIQIRPDMNLSLGEYVVMPDHFHGIVVIGDNDYNCNDHCIGCGDAMHCVPTMHCVSTTDTNAKFGPQSKNLASIIRGFKMGVTVKSRQIDPDFGWQSRYYDRIIRNNQEYERIAYYIKNNPKQWNIPNA